MNRIRAKIKLLQNIEYLAKGKQELVYEAGTCHNVEIIQGKGLDSLIFPSGFELYGVERGRVYQIMDDEDEIIVLTE